MPRMVLSKPRDDLYERLKSVSNRFKVPLSWIVYRAVKDFLDREDLVLLQKKAGVKAEICELLNEVGAMTIREIATKLDRTPSVIRVTLWRMEKDGEVVSFGPTRKHEWMLVREI